MDAPPGVALLVQFRSDLVPLSLRVLEKLLQCVFKSGGIWQIFGLLQYTFAGHLIAPSQAKSSLCLLQAIIGVKIYDEKLPADDLPATCWAAVSIKQDDGSIVQQGPHYFGRASDCTALGQKVLRIPWKVFFHGGVEDSLLPDVLADKDFELDLFSLKDILRGAYQVSNACSYTQQR